jgi:hypothetical protein
MNKTKGKFRLKKGGKRTRRVGRKSRRGVLKGGIFGRENTESLKEYDQKLEAFMVKFGINTNNMDWWDIDCIDQRNTIKDIFEYYALKNENIDGSTSNKWLKYYQAKVAEIKSFDLSGLNSNKENTCGYTQKCIQTNKNLEDLNKKIVSALTQMRGEIQNKQPCSDDNKDNIPDDFNKILPEAEDLLKKADDLLEEIKFYISMKEWIQIRERAIKTDSNHAVRNDCEFTYNKQKKKLEQIGYNQKMSKYIEQIDDKTKELKVSQETLIEELEELNDYFGGIKSCTGYDIDDTIFMLELKMKDLKKWYSTDVNYDELVDSNSYLSSIMKAFKETNLHSNKPPGRPAVNEYHRINKNPGAEYLDPSNSVRNTGYKIADSPNDNNYITTESLRRELEGDTYMDLSKTNYNPAADPDYLVPDEEDPAYLQTDFSTEPIYAEVPSNEKSGGRKSKKKSRSKFRHGKKRLTRK